MGVEHMESHEIQEAQAKAVKATQAPAGVAKAMRGEEKRRVDADTQAIREKITLIEKGLKHIVDNINKAFDNINNKPYVAHRLSDIIREHRQLLNEYNALETLVFEKMYKVIKYTTDGSADGIEEWKDTPAVRKAMEEIKGMDILAKLSAIRDRLELEFIDMYLGGIPDQPDDYPGTVEIRLIGLESGVNFVLGQLDELKGLLEELAGYDEKLDHPEQHHNTTH